ncbi:MAG: peroxiredoxin [Polyangiaceae bacterium]
MLSVGDRLPAFNLAAVVSREKGNEFARVSNRDFPGKWLVLFFWPMDFTMVCPTEVAEFGRKYRAFQDRDTQVIGASIDSQYVHLAWREHHPDLADIPFPMLADVRRDLSAALGVLSTDEGVALRATFVVDPEGIIRHVSVNGFNVGRNVDEVIRILDALQTDELCPCNWSPGQPTLS